MASHLHVPGCARLNVMRLNAARLNYYEPIPIAIIGGADRTQNVRIEGAAVAHVLNDAPDTASVRVDGFLPVAGQPFAIYVGDRSIQTQLIGGRVLETTALYEAKKNNVAYDLHVIDPTWLLNRRRVLASYAGLSATTIIYQLLAGFVRGVTANHVALNLPIIDAITFTNETPAAAITAVCERIGAYWFVDYADDLHVALSETTNAEPITDANPRGSRNHTLTEDLSQVVTRIIARGGSGKAFVNVAAGATELPVIDDEWFSIAGGIVEVAGSQRVLYASVKGQGGTGAIVGVATTPTSALLIELRNGVGLPAGVYRYAQTFTNATGETMPGPVSAASVGGPAPTLIKPAIRRSTPYGSSGLTPGGLYSWRIAVTYAGGGYSLGPPTDYVTVDAGYAYELYVGTMATDPVTGYTFNNAIMSGSPGAIASTAVYRTVNGGASWYYESGVGGIVGTSSGWWTVGASNINDALLVLQQPYPTGGVAILGQPKVQGIAPAPTGFTGTRLYRTAVNGTQLKLLVVNPGTSFPDTTTDAALGENAPVGDTAGVPPSNGQVGVGASEIPVTSVAPFLADGGAGWAAVGNMPIRYMSTAAGKLTGIPAAGDGSITATIRHGAQVLVVARLTGISASGTGAIVRAIKAGDSVTLRVELDDVAAQTALAARLGSADPASGVVEEPFTDSRMTVVELTNYGRALLADRKDPRRSFRCETRDESVEVGRLITVNLTTPPIVGTFRIQRVQFTEIAITGGLARVKALRTIEATNKLYTFADLLRRMRGREGGAW